MSLIQLGAVVYEMSRAWCEGCVQREASAKGKPRDKRLGVVLRRAKCSLYCTASHVFQQPSMSMWASVVFTVLILSLTSHHSIIGRWRSFRSLGTSKTSPNGMGGTVLPM